ncbi:hypothetical protein [Alkaliphilus serpentinus]|uniref:Uncharacterized protein n=1 Tax=Alkaliphilus serpentinus TaxID=1482731 RepID=A0A833HP29_9FIRM|nr:hypothetical protein [Alkaliphilus serpentinus]KAB3530263.1 hypothetical protein F8153_07550 [Alkaliphilus serpentinus]
MSTIYQFLSILVVLLLMGVPVIITVLLLKYFGRSTPKDELLRRIVKLEKRVEELEKELMDIEDHFEE